MPSNSHKAPAVAGNNSCDLNALSRQSLAALIREFLSGEITAFQFDDRLDVFRSLDDPVTQYVVRTVWYHYDDCDDHLVRLSKQEWDFFQRLLLILTSECQVEAHAEWRWSIKQFVAVGALGLFAFLAMQWGWGNHLLILAIPFGFLSIALSFWHPYASFNDNPYQAIIYPFATFADLEAAYRSSTFRKSRYPKYLETRKIRSPIMDAFWQLHYFTTWLLFSPVPLLFQSFPQYHSQTLIVATRQSTAS